MPAVLLPVAKQVVAADVRLVADRDEARHPEVTVRRLAQDGDAEAARLGREADAPAERRDRANVAFIETSGAVLTTPMQFGPTRRMPCRRASVTSSRSAVAPSAPVSANPALITTSPPTALLAARLDDRRQPWERARR